LNAKTGKPYWTYDLFAQCWGSPLIVDGKVYVGDEDGDVAVFEHDPSGEAKEPLVEINMTNSAYSTPVVANDVLYISNKSTLYAIKEGAKSDPQRSDRYPRSGATGLNERALYWHARRDLTHPGSFKDPGCCPTIRLGRLAGRLRRRRCPRRGRRQSWRLPFGDGQTSIECG